MRITVLSDNTPGRKLLAEHGLSLLIEADKRILFDTGASDVFLRNARSLGIDPDPDIIVLSHGHWDHGNGLVRMEGKRLVCHPGCFAKRFSKRSGEYLGLPLTGEEASGRFDLVESKNPVEISPKVAYLGEIRRSRDFEGWDTSYSFGDGSDDMVCDDSALAVRTSKGLVIIAGCSHSGICNIVDQARGPAVCGIERTGL